MVCGKSIPVTGKDANGARFSSSCVGHVTTDSGTTVDPRKSGIEIIGTVPWGTHFCQFYQTKQDLIDILVPYFTAGLESNEFCMWVTAEPLGIEEATEALRESVPDLDRRLAEGQIEIIPHTDWYLKDGNFDQQRVLNGWILKLKEALANGYAGLRLTGNTFWLEKDDLQAFADYEEAVHSVIGNYHILAACTYSEDKCGASEIADVVANHEFALMKRRNEWAIIESSTVKQTKQALKAALDELNTRSKELELLNEELSASTEELEVTNEELLATDNELRREIEERRYAEVELNRINRTLKAHSKSDQAMMRATNESDYLQEVCKIIVEDCGHTMVWVGFAENDKNKTVRPVAHAGFEEGYLEALNLTWADTERGRGPTGTAIRTGKPSTCRNMLTDPKFKPWREEAIKRGYASSIVLPLISNGKSFGAITIYSKDPDPFSEDETGLLTALANDLAYGITAIRLRAAHAKAEEALQLSEKRVRMKLDSILSPEGDVGNLELADILDVQAVQSLMDSFYELAHIPMAIIDFKGDMLVGVGWQDICTKFHRVHPETCKHCIESDTELSAKVPYGESKLYKCKNNMWDIATPIQIGGEHVGNLFSGQFFFDNEPLDYELFRSQAKQYGFNEKEYIAALDRVPRLSKEAINEGMAFFLKLSDMLSRLSYSNIKLARSLSERDTLMESLREGEMRLSRAQEIAHLGSWELDLINNRLSWSDEVYRIFGLQPQEFAATYEAFLEAVHPDDRAAVDAAYSGSLREGRSSYEIDHRIVRKSTGEVRSVREKCEHIKDESGRIIHSIGMVSDITERKQAEDDIKRNEARVESLLRMSQHPAASIQELLDFALDEAIALTGSKIGYIYHYDETTKEFTLNTWSKDVMAQCAITDQQTVYQLEKTGIWGEAVRQGRPIIVNDFQAPHPLKKGYPDGHAPLYRYMTLPVFIDEHIVGVVGVANKQTDYDSFDVQQLTLLTDSAWKLTERKRAEEELKRTNQRLNLLSETSNQLLVSDNPRQVVQSLCEKVMEHLDCHVFFNFLANEERGCLHLNAFSGVSEEIGKSIEWLDNSVTVCSCVARDGCRIVAENIAETLDPRTELVKGFGIQAYACHPLLGQNGAVIGTLSFGTKTRISFTDDELALMRAVTDQVATAMQRIRLLESERRRVAEMESFISSMSEGIVLHDAHGNAVLANQPAAEILGSDPRRSVNELVAHYDVYKLDGTPMLLNETAPYRALQGETVKDMHCKLTTPTGRAKVIAVSSSPVRAADGSILGATTVFRDITDQSEFERQKEEIYEREHHIAEVLQKALIPDASYDIPGCEVAVRYEAALKEAEVGGDFYDIFDLGDNKIGLLIGDVAGKGLTAAIQVAAARHSVRSYAYIDPRPGRVMTLVNDALSRDPLQGITMLTAFFAIVDLEVGVMSYANGGHETPILRHSDGRVDELAIEGRAVGVMEGYDYQDRSVILRPGDLVTMVTDGITEARPNSTDLFGLDRLKSFLSKTQRCSADELANGLLTAAKEHADGALRDDAAILVFGLKKAEIE